MHDDGISEICRHLVNNVHKRAFTLIGTNMPGLSLMATLDDHVVHDHTSMLSPPTFGLETR
jgi:hypothetical protein